MTPFDPANPNAAPVSQAFVAHGRHLLDYYRYSEPAPSERIVAAVKKGNSGIVGEMLREDPGLVHVVAPGADIERWAYRQLPPLALLAEDHHQRTLASAIGVFSATGIWKESGKWPTAQEQEAHEMARGTRLDAQLGDLLEMTRSEPPQKVIQTSTLDHAA